MKKCIRDLWVKALRSGKYKQTKGYLQTNKGFCCLGVLCDVYNKEQKKQKKRGLKVTKLEVSGDKDITCTYEFNREVAVLPSKVRNWAGLKNRDPYLQTGKGLENNPASVLNDSMGYSLKKIAKAIERTFP